MWILHFLPDAFLALIVNAVLILGIVATLITCFLLKYLIRLVPALSPHIRVAQIASVAIFLVGVYFKGGHSTEMLWRERVAEVEAKLKVAEQQSQAENMRIETKYIDRVKVIKQRGDNVVKYIDREVVKYDTKFAPGGICEIPQEFIQAHNTVAERAR
jgi:hypothetical protein